MCRSESQRATSRVDVISRRTAVDVTLTAIRKISHSFRSLSLFRRRQRVRESPRWPIIPVHQLTHLRIQQVDLFLDPETPFDELLSLVKGEIPVAPHVHPQLVEDIIMGIEHADEIALSLVFREMMSISSRTTFSSFRSCQELLPESLLPALSALVPLSAMMPPFVLCFG
jgi:hypothetical protein